MNKGDYIVYIKNQNTGKYDNKTTSIKSCTYDAQGYRVVFKGSNKIFNYSRLSEKIRVYTIVDTQEVKEEEIVIYKENEYMPNKLYHLLEPLIQEQKIMFIHYDKEILALKYEIKTATFINVIDDMSNKIVRKKNSFTFFKIEKIYEYNYFYKMIFKEGVMNIYPKQDIEISSLYKEIGPINYFKKVSEVLKSEKKEFSDFLYNQYQKLLVDDKSILFSYLNGSPIKETNLNHEFIFPFDFNISQIQATNNAFLNNISVIEGPPGTGKTQTILNIIANAILTDKTVAVVSGNNEAIKNIREKLKKEDIGFLTALLGSSPNRDTFFSEEHNIPDLSEHYIDENEMQKLKEEISISLIGLKNQLELNNRLALEEQELVRIKNEYAYFKDTFKKSEVDKMNFKRLSINRTSDFIVETYMISAQKKIGILKRFEILFKYRFINFKQIKNDKSRILLNLKNNIYQKKIYELENEIKSIKSRLEDIGFKVVKQEVVDKSMKLFKAKLFENYKQIEHLNAKPFSNNFKDPQYYINKFHNFIKKHPVILSTVHSLKNCSPKDYLYDYVIIDEASQSDIVASSLALSCAKNIIVVGDLKQIQHIVKDEIKEKILKLPNEYTVKECYNYIDKNILSSIKELYEKVPKTLLKEHYRCHPQIIEFCNKKFYDDELIIHTKRRLFRYPI